MQHWNSNNLPFATYVDIEWQRDFLFKSLMRSGVIEVGDIFFDHAMQMFFVQHEYMVKAFTPYTFLKTLAKGIGFWVRYGVRNTSIPVASATRLKEAPNLRSLSRIKKRGASPFGVASRNCCATQESVGERVTPKWTTRRDANSIMKNTYKNWKRKSITGRKSHAQICEAWFFKNVAQICNDPSRARKIYFWMVRLATEIPSFNNSPRIRSAPHSRFSRASCWMRAMVSAAKGERPLWLPDLNFQNNWNPCRCHFNNVSGLMIRSADFHWRSRLASTCNQKRSAEVRPGRLTWRRKTISYWRSRAFSMNNSALLRTRSVATDRAREFAICCAQRCQMFSISVLTKNGMRRSQVKVKSVRDI